MLRAVCKHSVKTRLVTPRLAAHRHGVAAAAAAAAAARRVYSTDNFMQVSNVNYIDEMYQAYLEDPNSVHKSWRDYFANMKNEKIPAKEAYRPPTNIPVASGGVPSTMPGEGGSVDMSGEQLVDHMKAQLMVRAFQVRGHSIAMIDPLGINFGSNPKNTPKELTLEYYGWTEKDLDKKITLGPGILRWVKAQGVETLTLRELYDQLKQIYCGSYGIEFVHNPDRFKCDWIRERVEIRKPYGFDRTRKNMILDRLIWSTQFEQYLTSKFPNDKKFGLEGCETMVPGMKALIDHSVERGVEDVVIGMPHRGRLNMLSNVIRKPNESIFSEFTGSAISEEGSGDMKYHLGANYVRPTPSGKKVNLSLVANPSHLEAEDPVVLGKTRAIQHYKNDETEGKRAMGVLLHGDAAFAGQGVVYESFGMHNLPSYSTGGTIHIIINNQIGFTTDPRFSRSTPYPSDIAKSIDAPIFHVNGDDIEAVIFIFELAAEWRATFNSDVIIDMVCYRKHGHNETDQPSFTQPFMYKRIQEKHTALDAYVEQLVASGEFTQQAIDDHKKWVWQTLDDAFTQSKDYTPTAKEWLSAAWEGFKTPKELANEYIPPTPTNVTKDFAEYVGKMSSTFDEKNFKLHRNLKRILNTRVKNVDDGIVDWATGEAMAFGTLAMEGYHVRVSGQDVERGTFSQRHAVLHDQVTEKPYVPLQHLSEDQAKVVFINSSLSEYGVMGFEYGYSLYNPNALVMWEAQFGDFANTAQVIIDQFIAAGESKWAQMSGLVLSLPHGFDGQASEHSSGRLERFLILGNEDPREFPSSHKLERQHQDANIQVVYPTTSSNLFHVLRRQMHRAFRKPLVVFFSKQLLRHPLARSPISGFSDIENFQVVLEDVEHANGTINPKESISRLILCSGQVYATLHKARKENQIKDIAMVKLEELHPFPFARLKEVIQSYPNLSEIVWCQEEPLNAGAWDFVKPRLATTLQQTDYSGWKVQYVGRDPSAVVAAGTKKQHTIEENQFVAEALKL